MEQEATTLLQQFDWDQIWKIAVTVLCAFLSLSGVVYVGAKYIKQAAEFTYHVVHTTLTIIGLLWCFYIFQSLGILGLISRAISAWNAIKAAFL